jgi:hypothetical protein
VNLLVRGCFGQEYSARVDRANPPEPSSQGGSAGSSPVGATRTRLRRVRWQKPPLSGGFCLRGQPFSVLGAVCAGVAPTTLSRSRWSPRQPSRSRTVSSSEAPTHNRELMRLLAGSMTASTTPEPDRRRRESHAWAAGSVYAGVAHQRRSMVYSVEGHGPQFGLRHFEGKWT